MSGQQNSLRPNGVPASPIPGQNCQNCPYFAGIDIQNIKNRMGTCWAEPPKMLGGVGGQIIVQRGPTSPDWWCAQHPMIAAMMRIKYGEIAAGWIETFNQQQLDKLQAFGPDSGANDQAKKMRDVK